METDIHLGEHGVFPWQWYFQMVCISVWKFPCHAPVLLIECQTVINNDRLDEYFK